MDPDLSGSFPATPDADPLRSWALVDPVGTPSYFLVL